LTEESGKNGIPPLIADGPGEEGNLLRERGRLAYYEICTNLVNTYTPANANLLRTVPDPTNRLGIYAYRLPDSRVSGIWVSYEDPENAAKKAQYARVKGLGGVALVDLSLDDFKGICDVTRVQYPILRAVKYNV